MAGNASKRRGGDVMDGIKIECHTGPVMDVLERMAREWPHEKLRQFAMEWEALEAAGAEIAEVQVIGNRVVGYPSEDFTLHLEKWGVAP